MNEECRIPHSDFCLLHLQVRRFPFFDDFRKGKIDLVFIEREPAQLCTDSLFFEFGTAPHKGRADHTDDDRSPIVLNEEGCSDEEKTNSHHVWPGKVAKISLTADYEGEAEADDGEGNKSDEDAECVHKFQVSD